MNGKDRGRGDGIMSGEREPNSVVEELTRKRSQNKVRLGKKNKTTLTRNILRFENTKRSNFEVGSD